MRLTGLVPMLQVDDIEATVAWYQETLGFTCTGRFGEDWSRLERDAVSLMFMRNDHMGAPHATATQYIYVDDAMALWEAIKDRCTVEWGPERYEYGNLEFAIKDINEYLISFGQPVD